MIIVHVLVKKVFVDHNNNFLHVDMDHERAVDLAQPPTLLHSGV